MNPKIINIPAWSFEIVGCENEVSLTADLAGKSIKQPADVIPIAVNKMYFPRINVLAPC